MAKTRTGIMKIGDAEVQVKVEEVDHASEHVLRFTATCGESVKSGHVTLKAGENDTQESIETEIRRLGRMFAAEAAQHARTQQNKAVFFSKEDDLFKEDE